MAGTNPDNCWAISIAASYPEKSAVVIANANTGEYWAATYSVDAAGLVTFPNVVKAEQTFTAAESAKIAATGKRLREAAAPTKLKETLRFTARIREVKLDAKGGASAECVMLAEGPGNSADGHYYSAACIEDAAASGVFEGVQSYADHADELEERVRPERSVRDLVGWWSDVHAEESGGKALLVGTFNIESGNEFALNKMREAKRYAEKYPDAPDKQYVGFSIYAGGMSEPQEIDGKTYDIVQKITEAGSTDMVTRAGAGGKLITLKEAQKMGETISPEKEKKFLESLISGITKNLTKSVGKTVRESVRKNAIASKPVLSEATFNAALRESGVEMDDDAKGKMHAALAKAMEPKKKGSADDEDVDKEDMDAMEGDGATGDASLDDILEPDEDDEEDEDEEGEVGDDDPELDDTDDNNLPKGKKMAEARKNLPADVIDALRERDVLKAREAMRARVEVAKEVIREKKVPKAAQRYMLTELAACKSRKAMRERADAIIDAVIRPAHGDGVVGNPQSDRVRESGGGLLTVSGVEK